MFYRSFGSCDLWMRNASNRRISTTLKHTACRYYALGLPPFFLWLTGYMPVPVTDISQRDLFCEIVHIFELRQSHSEALLFQPCKTFASCDGRRRGPII